MMHLKKVSNKNVVFQIFLILKKAPSTNDVAIRENELEPKNAESLPKTEIGILNLSVKKKSVKTKGMYVKTKYFKFFNDNSFKST